MQRYLTHAGKNGLQISLLLDYILLCRAWAGSEVSVYSGAS